LGAPVSDPASSDSGDDVDGDSASCGTRRVGDRRSGICNGKISAISSPFSRTFSFVVGPERCDASKQIVQGDVFFGRKSLQVVLESKKLIHSGFGDRFFL